MKVTAFVGSARKRGTYNTTQLFMNNLQSLGDVDCEIVRLCDYRLGVCKGCKRCFDDGKEFCPLNDDRDALFEKINNSDGVVFATPNYSFHVSGQMKIFLDRLGYACHRPPYFGKVSTGIVYQGIIGGSRIKKYFDMLGLSLGFNTVKGSCLTSFEPPTEKTQKKIDRVIAKHSRRFYTALKDNRFPPPTFFRLMGFRMARTSMREQLDETAEDYRHFKKNGWFESDYYYTTRLNPVKKLAGKLFDMLAYRMYKK